jgi:hypothetical protein
MREETPMKNRHKTRSAAIGKSLLLVVVLVCQAWMTSCSKKTATGGPAGAASPAGVPAQFYTPPGAVFQATYTPNTVRIDFPTAKRTLRSVSPDGRVFVFDGSDSRLQELAKGKVLFLEHLGVRRVLDVQKQGSQVAVLTEAASLTDFIQDGRIQFTAPINFGRSRAQLAPAAGPRQAYYGFPEWFGFPATVYAEEETNKGKIGLHSKGEINSWEYELEGEPEGDGFSLSLDVGKKLAGLTVSVKTKGDLSHVSTAFNAVIHGGKMDQFEYSTPLSGKLHVAWAALTSGPNSGIGESRLKLPPFAKDVFDIYGVPLLFRIDEALIFTPGLGTQKDAAEGGFDLAYDGTDGLSVNGGQSSPEGSMQAEPTLEKTTAESLAAHGIVLAVDAPKISVSLGTESIMEAIKEAIPSALEDKVAQVLENGPFGLGGLVKKAKEDFFKLEGAAYVQLVTEFDYAGSGPMSIVPCSMTHFNFFAQAGADAQIGMVKGESPHLDLYKTSKTVRDPDIPACGQK